MILRRARRKVEKRYEEFIKEWRLHRMSLATDLSNAIEADGFEGVLKALYDEWPTEFLRAIWNIEEIPLDDILTMLKDKAPDEFLEFLNEHLTVEMEGWKLKW